MNQFPEIRQDKVAALQRAMQEGSYEVTAAASSGRTNFRDADRAPPHNRR